MVKVKVTCFTPKGKAEECEKKWRDRFPTFKNPLEKGIVSDREFYWVYDLKDMKDVYRFHKKILMAEGGIRAVYGIIIRFFTRANKLMNKGRWTTDKVKKWLLKRWSKSQENSTREGGGLDAEKIGGMDDEEFKDYIKMKDIDDMREFLAGDLIKYEIVEGEK